MEIEFVFSGICNFVNMRNDDPTTIGPSVILIKADEERLPAGHDHGGHGGNASEGHEHPADGEAEPEEEPDNDHIPYLAFDSRLVQVNDDFGFDEVPNAGAFQFLRLDDVEVQIADHGVGVPILDATFQNVIDDDDFGITTQCWNRDAVPAPGGRPKKSVVAAWMTLGRGRMYGGRLCPFKWKVTKVDGTTFARHFAEEAVYCYEDTEDDFVSLLLADLEDRKLERRLVFRPVAGRSKVTLFIGNNIKSDMESAVRRRRPRGVPSDAGHFAFFHNALDLPPEQLPALPEPVEPTGPETREGGGGPDGGICGPKKG